MSLYFVVQTKTLFMKSLNLTAKDVEKVKKAAALISSSLENHHTIVEVAKAVQLPEKRLKYAFKQLMGHGLYGYLQLQRMEKAKALMLEGEKIKHIVPKVGYANEANFSKAFKKVYKELPTQWRKGVLAKTG